MNALALRDKLFSNLHMDVLKVHGFKKRGHWSICEQGSLLQTVYLRASRWSNHSDATFWLDIQVFSKAWHDLVFSPKVFSKPSEGTPSLVSEELGMMCAPPLRSFTIDASTDFDTLKTAIAQALRNKALPIFTQCSSLEGVLLYLESQKNPRVTSLTSAGICLLLNRPLDAKMHMEKAKEMSPHENYLEWLLAREKTMWSNLSFDPLTSCRST